MKQEQKQLKVKGSVLLTVTMVMFIMVMFLMSTLVLTKSASRRTYYTYFETQAQLAAEAALDAITNNAYVEESFSQYVRDLGSANGTFRVYFDDTDIPLKETEETVGGVKKIRKYVECTVQKLDEKNYVWDEKSNQLKAQDGWRIIATAEVGHGENASKSTVVNNIYATMDASGTNSAMPANVWDYQYMRDVQSRSSGSSSGTSGSSTPAIESDGCISLDEVYSGEDASDTLGVMNAGLNTFPDGRTRYRADGREIKNDGISSGKITYVNTSKFGGNYQHYALVAGTGLIEMGNMDTQNFMFAWSNTKASDVTSYRDLPYVYVDGQVQGKQMCFGLMGTGSNKNTPTMPYVGFNGSNLSTIQTDANKASTLNVYAGSYYEGEKREIRNYGDIYLYETDSEKGKSRMIGGNSATKMVQFVVNNLDKTNGTKGTTGGNIITNNAEFQFDCGNDAIEIGGDFIFTNPNGTLVLKGTKGLKVKGAVVIKAASISVQDGPFEITASGGFYLIPNSNTDNTSVASINGTLKVNGVTVGSLSDAAGTFTADSKITYIDDNRAEKEATQTATAARIPSLGINVTGTDYAELVTKIRDARVGYPSNYVSQLDGAPDYSLFPYAQRLDEIWEEYVRWDIWQSANTPGFGSTADVNNYLSGNSVDNLIKESKAAGHQYGPVAKSGQSGIVQNFHGTRQFIATHPHDGESSNNSFIPKLTTFDAATIKDSIEYCDSYSSLCEKYGGVEKKLPKYTGSTQPVNMYYHSIDGTDVSETAASLNMHVINKNCTLEVKDGETYFLDPTAYNHSKTDPLVVAIYSNGDPSATIYVNNSAIYEVVDQGVATQRDYTKPYPYGCDGDHYANNRANDADKGKKCMNNTTEGVLHASREDVIIYIIGGSDSIEGFNGNLGPYIWGNQMRLDIIPSGAYAQQDDVDYVVNAPFPDRIATGGHNTDGSKAWVDYAKNERYKFEVIPNVKIYAHSGTIKTGASKIWGAVVCPNTEYDALTSPNDSNTFTKVKYRMSLGSEPITFDGSNKYICLIGSVCASKASIDNKRGVVFGGSLGGYTPGSNTPTTETKYSTSQSGGSSQANRENRNKYFDNDYMSQG